MRVLLLLLLFSGLLEAQTLRHEWDFAQGAAAWLPAHSTTARLADGALRVEVTGDDPYLHCAAGNCLDLAATPGQFVRIRLRSNQPGSAEFFWAATTEGRDAGFVAGQEVHFAVAAGDWQELDIYPAWSGRVTRLRFDPPGAAGTVIELARIAIYEWPDSAQAGPSWDLTRDHGGWLPRGGGLMSLGPAGLTIAADLPELGRAVPPGSVPSWLTIDGEALAAGLVEASWRGADQQARSVSRAVSGGPFHLALRLDRDGVGPVPGDDLRLAYYAERPPARLSLRSISIGAAPAGPARLDLLSAQLDRATAVGDEPVTVEARLQNAGGSVLAAGRVPTSGDLTATLAYPALAPGEQIAVRGEVRRSQPSGGRLILGEGPGAVTLLLRASAPPGDPSEAGASVTATTAALVGERIRLRAGAIGPGRYGPLRLDVRAADGWRTVGSLDGPGDVELAAARASLPGVSARVDGDALVLTATSDTDPAVLSATYRLVAADAIAVSQTLTAREPLGVRFFAGPWLRAGDGASGAAKREALFPGIEYLGGDVGAVEESSSRRDIAPPGDLRAVPDRRNITIPLQAIQLSGGELVALWWPIDARGTMPAAIFASPNFVEAGAGRRPRTTARSGNNHLLGLFWPPVPDPLGENELQAEEPVALKSGETLRIEATILARPQGEVLDAVDAWIAATQPAHAGSAKELLPETMRLTRTAYEKVLWREGRGWVSHIAKDDAGWNPLVPILYRYLAVRLPEPGLADLAAKRLPRTSDLSLALHQGNLPAAFRAAAAAGDGALAARDDDGRWRFNPDPQRAVLGPKGETNVGIMAPHVVAILRAARAGADERLLAEGLKGLEQLRAFRVPRGAQVWEVPLHAPDILASAIACDAFTLGYTLTGEREYLADAEYWARTALPFIYHWQDPRPEVAPMRGGTIPVFGATYYTNSWFGRLVQWNGLALARSLYQLARVGGGAPWARVAEDITVSAMRQQVADPSSPIVGLYPDYWNMRTGIPGYWMSPTPVLARALEAQGETPEGDWRVIRNDGRLIALAAPTPIGAPRLNQQAMGAAAEVAGRFSLNFDIAYPLGPSSYVGLSGVAQPAAVRLGGAPVAEGLADPPRAGWQYYPDQALLVLRLNHEAGKTVAVDLEGLRAADPPASRREWQFTADSGGWDGEPHEVTVSCSEERLVLTATGDDPYLSGPALALPTASISRVVIRARTSVAGPITLFFATDRGGYSEQQVLRTSPLPADGAWHEVAAETAGHTRWAGQLRRLRIDPPGSAGAVTEIASIALR